LCQQQQINFAEETFLTRFTTRVNYDLRNSALVLFESTANYLFSQFRLQTLIQNTGLLPAFAKLAVKYWQGR